MTSLINAAASYSSSSLPRSSTDHQNHYPYEVFLSFRGEDTRFNFTDHLYTALCQRGIETFRDDKLSRGEDISQELLKAIDESRVSIIVFSQNYAASRWCLDELVKILECRKSKGQDVRPVFYKVDPSDVRHQRGAFGDAFATLDQCKYKDSMDKWKAALKEAADLSGWPFKDGEYESKFINDIVGELSARVVNPSCELQVAAHPIGIESCRQDVNKLLHTRENIVRMVGIWGPGGIGKTTIAKDVYNSIRQNFEGSCFLADVRSYSNDLAQLQETLLSNILNSTLKVSSVDEGVSLIKTRMRRKKILLILDDVSHSRQLQNLVPSPDCFGLGSRILITTRDKRLLIAHEVEKVYEVKMLNHHHALELFSLNAFKRNGPPGDYLELAERAVCYAQGLPLALIVLGSHLFSRSREEWEATLDSCRAEDPYRVIRDVLKISYDALGVDLKGYFLDIACFFKGKHVDDVKPILEACYNLKSVNGIAQLQEKALIRIEYETYHGGRIWMHDLIEEMGKDIVYQESPDEPGERSRVWSEEDVDNMLTHNTGTNEVIGIQVPRHPLYSPLLSLLEKKSVIQDPRHIHAGALNFLRGITKKKVDPNFSADNYVDSFEFFPRQSNISPRQSAISLNAKSFSEMKKLRYISMSKGMKYEPFSGDIDYLSHQLRWLDWPQCPLQSFPSNFYANRLVKFNIPDSRRITRLWEGCKNFSKLTCMNLRGCTSLTTLPDFSRMPNLEELDLSGTCIKELHPSITKLVGLKVLILIDCQNLTALPDKIYELGNLQVLDASHCPKLAAFPEILIKMDCLRRLFLRGSDIRELDESIGNLIGLELLNLNDCINLTTLPCSIYGLQNLKMLSLNDCSKLARFTRKTNISSGCSLSLPKLVWFSIKRCNLSDCDFLKTLDCWETLEWLDLSYNNFVSLPVCTTKFFNLRWLCLNGCKRLRGFPDLKPSVEIEIRL